MKTDEGRLGLGRSPAVREAWWAARHGLDPCPHVLEPVPGRPRWESVDQSHHMLSHVPSRGYWLSLAGVRRMKPQISGPPLALSVLCLSFVEIEMGSCVAQVSLYIYYVTEGDPHLCPDPWSAGITSPGDGTWGPCPHTN